MIILDASALIAHFESTDEHHADATALLTIHAAELFGSSVVTLAEVYVGAARAGQADRLDRLLARLNVKPLDLPAGSARRLGELRAITNLKMPDCCVLYTAEYHAAAIATFDGKLAARAVDLGLSVAQNTNTTGQVLHTQPITGSDLSAGRIRIPVHTKPSLPPTSGVLRVILRGRVMEVQWNPRTGADRSRPGVLSIDRSQLASAVTENEELTVSIRLDGTVALD